MAEKPNTHMESIKELLLLENSWIVRTNRMMVIDQLIVGQQINLQQRFEGYKRRLGGDIAGVQNRVG